MMEKRLWLLNEKRRSLFFLPGAIAKQIMERDFVIVACLLDDGNI